MRPSPDDVRRLLRIGEALLDDLTESLPRLGFRGRDLAPLGDDRLLVQVGQEVRDGFAQLIDLGKQQSERVSSRFLLFH